MVGSMASAVLIRALVKRGVAPFSRGAVGQARTPVAARLLATEVTRTVQTDGAPVLRQVAEDVPNVGAPPVRRLVDEMLYMCAAEPALGLAAPQVGESLRLFVMRTPLSFFLHPLWGGDEYMPYMPVINPVITARSAQMLLGPEACLSLPASEAVIVPRHSVITVRYLTLKVRSRSTGCLSPAHTHYIRPHNVLHIALSAG